MSAPGRHERESLLFISRRGLLRAGLFGTTAVWMGGFVACGPGRTAGGVGFGLSPAGKEILRAISPVVLGGLLPETGPERARALDTGLASLDEYVAHLSSPLQREVEDLFETLDLWPVRVLLTGGFSRWADCSPEALESFLRSAQGSRIFLLRRVYALLQSLVVLNFFDQPVAWKSVGYPGPPLLKPDPRVGRVENRGTE
ncbi:MAG: hypothetical protein GY946_14275 [bacterium]|nr:hypothetical protein [bacterium]